MLEALAPKDGEQAKIGGLVAQMSNAQETTPNGINFANLLQDTISHAQKANEGEEFLDRLALLKLFLKKEVGLSQKDILSVLEGLSSSFLSPQKLLNIADTIEKLSLQNGLLKEDLGSSKELLIADFVSLLDNIQALIKAHIDKGDAQDITPLLLAFASLRERGFEAMGVSEREKKSFVDKLSPILQKEQTFSKVQQEVLNLSFQGINRLKKVLHKIEDIKALKSIKTLEQLVTIANKKGLSLQSLHLDIVEDEGLIKRLTPKELTDSEATNDDSLKKNELSQEPIVVKSHKTYLNNLLERTQIEKKSITTPTTKITLQEVITQVSQKPTIQDAEMSDDKMKGVEAEVKEPLREMAKIENLVDNKSDGIALSSKKEPSKRANLAHIALDNKPEILQKEERKNPKASNIRPLELLLHQTQKQKISSRLPKIDPLTHRPQKNLQDFIAIIDEKNPLGQIEKIEATPLQEATPLGQYSNDQRELSEIPKDVQKASVRNMASSIKEVIDDYKPPVMKLSLEINPAKLGKIDIEVINRGGQLYINLGSNQQALQMLSTNMAEFKNALNDLGFNEVNMNFSSSDDRGQGSGKGNQEPSQEQNPKDQNDQELKEIEPSNEPLSRERYRTISSLQLRIPNFI